MNSGSYTFYLLLLCCVYSLDPVTGYCDNYSTSYFSSVNYPSRQQILSSIYPNPLTCDGVILPVLTGPSIAECSRILSGGSNPNLVCCTAVRCSIKEEVSSLNLGVCVGSWLRGSESQLSSLSQQLEFNFAQLQSNPNNFIYQTTLISPSGQIILQLGTLYQNEQINSGCTYPSSTPTPPCTNCNYDVNSGSASSDIMNETGFVCGLVFGVFSFVGLTAGVVLKFAFGTVVAGLEYGGAAFVEWCASGVFNGVTDFFSGWGGGFFRL
jgi:hypothetical protein